LSRTELFAAIRRDKRLDPELSQRARAEKYGVHRRTVRQALLSAVPPPRKKPVPRAAVLDPAKPWIDEMLREDASAPRKQKHAARRIHQRLVQEYEFDLVSYSTVCDYVLARRPQIEAEVMEGRRHLTGMVLQVHLPGEEAEVDFADVWPGRVNHTNPRPPPRQWSQNNSVHWSQNKCLQTAWTWRSS